jgi:hypothetical protein
MQLTLLDIINDITGEQFCEICDQHSEADCCSEECSQLWVKLYIEDVWEIKKED